MFADIVFGRVIASVDSCPWGAASGRDTFDAASQRFNFVRRTQGFTPLYTPEQKRRRDASPWTVVQGILAPVQFLIFAASLVLVLRFLVTGQGGQAAIVSVLVKTAALYTIMVTGAIWEHEIFGRYLFAPAFWWEDAFSMVVIALHTAYVAALLSHGLDTQNLMLLALAAYAAYAINATQFVLKLRAARRGERVWAGRDGAMGRA